MGNNLIEMLNEVLDGNTPPNTDQLFKIMDETFSLVKEMKGKFDSNDPEKKEEAIQQAAELKKALEAKIGVLAERSGIDPATFLQNPEGLAPEDLQITGEAKERLDELLNQQNPHKLFKQIIR